MRNDFITCILRLPANEVMRFQAMAREACANAATPQLKRLPLPYVSESVLRMLGSKEEADIAARLLDDLGRLVDTVAAKDFNTFVANGRMVKSSADLRAHCLKRAPVITLARDEDAKGDDYFGLLTDREAVKSVQAIWRVLLGNGLVASTERDDGRTWYRFGEVDMQSAYDFAEVRTKAIENWHALQKPVPKSRTRLIKRH